MNWLITGGCGFIGTALIRTLLATPGHHVRAYDNLTVGARSDLAALGAVTDLTGQEDLSDWTAPLSLVEADILDRDRMAQACVGADIVVHLAANTGVGPSVENPFDDCNANVLGTLNMLEGARHAGAKRVIFASSGAPLGVQVPPMHEDMAPHPASPYGASKLAGEGYCSAYYHCFGVETVVLRFGNVYGEGSVNKHSVVAKFIKQAMAGETLEIYGDGSQTRDFIYLGDLVAAIRAASQTAGVGGEVFQIATAAETTLAELTQILVQVLRDEAGIEAKWINAAVRQGDVARNYSDTRKAAERLNWRVQVPLAEGLRRTVAFFAQQQAT